MNNFEYPKEFYIPLENNEHLLGQIEVNKTNKGFNADISIVFKETKKIYKHIDQVFDADDEVEACDIGVMKLSRFLKSLK